MIIKAYAKINISLDVVGKKDNGYHLLKMIMQNIDIYDVINIKKKDRGISISCNKKFVPVDERNIAYKAAKLFFDSYNINKGVQIDIKKDIPVAAGLAGGSSNAAAVLKAMRDIFEVEADDEELMKIGLKLGADVPYCIKGGTALCEGIGEVITPLKPFKGCILVLVKPSFGVSTKDVYSEIDIKKIIKHPDTDGIIRAMEEYDLETVGGKLRNVLENVTLRKHKIIRDIKEDMHRYGAVGTLMSGSGPSTYGLFDDMLKAQKCYDFMKKSFEEVFITRTI